MVFPAMPKEAKTQSNLKSFPEDLSFPNDVRIHFVNKLKYLGSIITLLLNEDAKI